MGSSCRSSLGRHEFFAVASTDEAVAAAETAGGKTLTPAQASPYGRFAVLEDRWGAAFSVMEATAG